ncbi:Paired amphipathic helix protein Sin3-like 3, partial [Dichanthelium oligosanthes]
PPPPPPQASLTTGDALTYLKSVKETFQDRRHKYEEFLEVMRDFKSSKIDTGGVIIRVKTLFHGHPDLILGFNAFLPKGYAIKHEDLDKKPVDFAKAISFVNTIKSRFQQEDHVYKSFLGILNMYRTHNKPIQDVYEEVATLFHAHPDLLEEFKHFLPDASGPPQAATTSRVRHDEKNTVMHSARSVQAIKRERGFPPIADRDSTVDHPDPEHDLKRRCTEKEKNRNACHSQDRRDYERNDKDDEYDNGGKMEGTGDDTLGGPSISPLSFNDNYAVKSSNTQEFHFCEKVKVKLGPEAYKEFLKCLNIYSQEIITRSELKILVKDMLRHFPDLVNGFNEFLEHCENIDGFLEGILNESQTSRTVKTMEKDRDKEHGGQGDHDKERKEREKPERVSAFNSKEGTSHKATAFPSKEKYNLCKPISELDLSNCEQCTPSYRLLPKNHPMPPASNLTDIGASVLNDLWVSVTSGSEDYSFKHMRKNQYEESLFRCEDDRFELDMLLESVNVAIKRVEELIEKMEYRSLKPDSSIDIDEHLTFLLAEIKEINEKKRKGDDVLLAVAAGNRRPIVPNMSFEYVDSDIHEDLYQIIKYSCGEVCSSSDQVDKVMRIWTTFLEPILGIQHRDHGTEDAGMVKAKSRTRKVGLACGEKRNKATANGAVAVKPANSDEATADAQDGSHEADRTFRRGEDLPNAALHGRVRSTSPAVDKVATLTAQNISTKGSVGNTDLSPSEKNQGRANMELVPGSNTSAGAKVVVEFKGGNETIPSMGDREAERITSLYGVGVKAHPFKYSGSHNNSKPEREEGELSPNGDFEEENFGVFEVEALDGTSKQKEGSTSRSLHGRPKEVVKFASENHADADDEGDESAQRSTEDSENASEAGEDASDSESGGGEEFSREDHEEEEDDPDTKAQREGGPEVTDSQDLDVGLSLPFSERLHSTVKPLSKYVATTLQNHEDKVTHIFYGNDSFYVLFRLHQILYERVLSAKTNSSTSEKKWRASKDTNSPDQYSKFISALYSLLDGSSDSTKFEDDCRSIIGTQSYVLFTLDRLIHKVLQAVASDEIDNKLLQLYLYEKSRSPGRFFDLVYHENARVLLHDESIYRFECHSNPTRLSVQLMEYGNEKPEVTAVSVDPSFSLYLNNDYLSSISDTKLADDVFLRRNLYYGYWIMIQRRLLSLTGCSGMLEVSIHLEIPEFFLGPKRNKLVFIGG